MSKLPKNHKIWVTVKTEAEEEYIISSHEIDRSKYFLYKKIGDNDFQQISTSSDPRKLEEKVFEETE